jgi:hypothetical protein
MVQFSLWIMLCLFAHPGLFSLEHTRVDKSLSKY